MNPTTDASQNGTPMPQRISTVQLSDNEKAVIRTAADARRVRSILSELADQILGSTDSDDSHAKSRRAKSPATAVTNGPDSLDVDRITESHVAMQNRREAVEALPETPARTALLTDLDKALAILEEAATLASNDE